MGLLTAVLLRNPAGLWDWGHSPVAFTSYSRLSSISGRWSASRSCLWLLSILSSYTIPLPSAIVDAGHESSP